MDPWAFFAGVIIGGVVGFLLGGVAVLYHPPKHWGPPAEPECEWCYGVGGDGERCRGCGVTYQETPK